MSKRLQVLIDETELGELRVLAKRHGMTVSEWVRQAIRTARRTESAIDPGRKLDVIRSASAHAFPTGDIDQLLAQIERGYLGDEMEGVRQDPSS